MEKGIYRIRGDVRVNRAPAKEGQDVRAGDVITTGGASEAVFVAGKGAFLVPERSRVEVEGAPQKIMGASLINHTDIELGFLEGLVGRWPPLLEATGHQPGSYY